MIFFSFNTVLRAANREVGQNSDTGKSELCCSINMAGIRPEHKPQPKLQTEAARALSIDRSNSRAQERGINHRVYGRRFTGDPALPWSPCCAP